MGGTGVEADEDAETLIMLTEKAHLKQVLSPGTFTWQRHKSKSTLDLVFLSLLLRNSLLECQKTLSSDTHSDHEPIRTVISLSTIEAEKCQMSNWNKTNIMLLRQRLDCNLQNSSTFYLPGSKTWDSSQKGLDKQIGAIICAIQNAIHASTPQVNISLHSQAGFTLECKEAQLNAKRLKRQW